MESLSGSVDQSQRKRHNIEIINPQTGRNIFDKNDVSKVSHTNVMGDDI